MNLCSDNHDEVCHEGRQCPVCDKMQDIKILEAEIEGLQKQIEELSHE